MKHGFSIFAAALALAGGCSDSTPGGSGAQDAASSSDADAAADVPSVRFVVMGDTGEGNEAQAMIGDAIAAKCAADGCDFVLLLGDNIYDDGVSSVDDPQWQTKFEQPYEDVDLPFYVVLGNHDYGGQLGLIDTPGIGNEWDKGLLEVEYSDYSSKWIMPDTHYTLRREHVGFVMLDTNSILWDNTDYGDQREWYPEAMDELEGAEWIIAAGHHPYLSNGTHGNAGSYESIEVAGVEIPNPIPILNGENVEDFFDEVVCGTVDVYFAGHDHNRQWLDENDALCGAELIVSGAGAKLTAFASSSNAVHWQDDGTEGFLYVVIEGPRFRGQFIDKDGQVSFEREFLKSL